MSYSYNTTSPQKWQTLSPYEVALHAAEHLHWSVIPVDINKKPYFSWKPYQQARATTEQIIQWQKQYNPPAWAVITGAISNLVILDGDGDPGRETFGKLGINPHRRTGSGGLHADFEYPGWHVPTLNSKSKIELGKRWPGLDIRGDGGYAIFCGKNASGEYVWLREPGTTEALDTLPNDLRKFLSLLTPPEADMKRSIAEVALEKYLSEASLRGRDNACFDLACQLRDNNYSQQEAGDVCADYARRVHGTNQKGEQEPFTEEEARAKVASAYGYAKRTPWSSTTPYTPGQNHSKNGNGNGHQKTTHGDTVTIQTILQRLGENEYGDGLLFAEVFNGQVCYDHSDKVWYLWNEHHWKKDTTGKIKQMVSGHLGSIYLKARGDIHKELVEVQADYDRIKKEDEDDEKLPKLKKRLAYLTDTKDALEKRASHLRGANRMKNVLTFAMSEHNIGITGDIWDSDPWLLGVKNGVIDLRTGERRDGYPIDYIRSVSPTEWAGINTSCPRFERFLQEIFADKPEDVRSGLISFLQRLFGYAMTGLTTEHIFPLFFGKDGRNGKDTLFTILKFVLGTGIANAVSNDVFLSADKGRQAGAATPHLADLQGKRMVWGSETKQGDKINVSQIKQITGGGDISARKNYGDQYSFTPSHTLFLVTNYKPHADSRDKAFWTRTCLVEFNMRFVDKPQADNERVKDINLPSDLESEASGILSWLVRGCLAYQKEGLNRPEIVKIATESYRESEDTVQQFIDECCVRHDNASVGAKRLYDVYKTWCEDNNIKRMNGNLFGEDMAKRFEKVHTRKGAIYNKIGILTDDLPPNGDGTEGKKAQCDGSKCEPSQPSQPPSEAASDTAPTHTCDGSDGTFHKVPYIAPLREQISNFMETAVTPSHCSVAKDGVEQPVERVEGTVTAPKSAITAVTVPSHTHKADRDGKMLTPPTLPTPPQRSCLHCGIQNWQWDTIFETYYCGECANSSLVR